MSHAIFPNRLLFTVTAPCPYLPDAEAPLEQWPAEALLPPLGELDGEAPYAAVRAAWPQHGLLVAATVPRGGPLTGNRQRPASGDSLQVWVDLHPGPAPFREARAVRHFVALPATPGGEGPLAWEQPLRGASRPPAEGAPQVRLLRGEGSYTYVLELTWEALGGRPDPEEGLGLEYLITDTALGSQTWATPRELADALKAGRRPAYGEYLRFSR